LITGTNSFNGNNDYGLEIDSKGAVTLENITADGNKTQDGVNIDNNPSAVRDVTLTGVLSFNNNGNGDRDDGLYIESRGSVTLADVVATGNKDEGVEINNTAGRANRAVTIGGTNVFSNNSRGGLLIRSDGNVSLNNVTADNGGGNGVRIENHTSNTRGFVSITGTNSFSGNSSSGLWVRSDGYISVENATADNNKNNYGAHLDNDESGANASSYVSILGTNNSFSGNGGPGLDIDTRGDIEVHFATINNNNQAGGANGGQFNTRRNAKVYCSVIENNSGIGLNASGVNGSLDFYGMDGFSDYSYNGTAGFIEDDCFVPVYGCTDPEALNYNSEANIDDESCEYASSTGGGNGSGGRERNTVATSDISVITVTSGQLVALSCETSMTKLLMEDGDYVIFADLCGYDALMDEVPEDALPDGLPGGDQYVSGLNVAVTKDGLTTEPLPVGTSMTVAFMIPEGMEGESFSIMRWNGSDWVEENVSIEDGYVRATTNHTGTFVLVTK
jgi:hypothetical protein